MQKVFLSLCLLFALCSYEQVLPFRIYTQKDGLNSNSVSSVVRDDRGLLWIGTPFGINWFDGTHFFQPSVPKRIDQLYVQHFYKDREGIVWTLTFYNGFYKFQNNRFTQYLIDTSYSDLNKNNILDMVEIDSSHYVIAADRGVYLFNGKMFNRLDRKNLDGQIETVDFYDGYLFVGFGKGLYCYKYDNGWKLVSKNIENVSVNRVVLKNDQAWIATDKGLYYFDHFDAEKNNQPAIVYEKSAEVMDVSADIHNDIWFTGNQIVYKLEGEKPVEYNSSTGLKAAPNHVYFDDQNIGWFSTYEGLYKLGDDYFSFKEMKDAPISFAKLNDKIWMSYSNGISEISGNNHYTFDPNVGFTILYYAGVSKQLWVANNGGLFELKNRKPQKRFSLHCSYLFEDTDSITWIATDDARLFILRNDELQQIHFDCFRDDFISTVFRDENGFVWLGFRTGGILKCRFENNALKTVQQFSLKTGFDDLRVRSCCADGHGNILFGTRTNGLFIFSSITKSYWHINDKNGLNATWINAISASDTAIYLATNNGLFMLKKHSAYDHFQIVPVSFPNDAVSKEMNCVLADDKQVLIGSNGLIRFMPAKFQRDTLPAPVFITQVSIDGKADNNWSPYGSQQLTLHLPYNKNVIAFEFAGVHLKDEDGLHYRYKLEGQDKDWSSASDRNFVSYNLPPGKYRFVVQAENAAGIWSNRPATYAFIIAQPFWAKWWFVTLNFLLAVGVVYLIYRYRLKQVVKFERLRYKISTDLHDDIGSTLSSISILSEMALSESSRQQNEAMVAEIKENSLSLLEKMDDIVWSINPKNDSLESLLLRIKRFSSTLFEAKDIDYSIDIDKAVADIKLPMDYRQHLYLIMKEAINNLVKYSNATKAAIEVNYGNSILKIRISDNGNGFDMHSMNFGNGVISMRNRADVMKADLKIESNVGEGTTIRLQVKIK